ncbi:MAG: family 20 glycosylhydrolase [Candidatus Helarchaeota archaeon]
MSSNQPSPMKGIVLEGFEPIENVSGYQLHLLPSPQEIDEIYGFYQLKEELGIAFYGIEAEELILETIKEELDRLAKVSCKKQEITSPVKMKTLEIKADPVLNETYALYFEKDLLFIIGYSDKAVYYGINTFLQLLKVINGKIVIPLTQIYDYPVYQLRAITDQTTRNQIPTIANLKQTIKFLSKFKVNTLFLYMEDSFNFKKYPDIGKTRGGYTDVEIKDLQNYAKRYFVTLIPIFNLFGHVDDILMTEYPKYAHLGEFPGASCYDIGNPDVKQFIQDLLKELCEAFDSTSFHLGLDETFDFGKYKTRQLIEEKGKGEVLLDYYNWLIRAVKKLGMTQVFCYHDNILAEKTLLEKLPKDLIVFYWDYFPRNLLGRRKTKYKKAELLKKAGFPVVLSPTLYDFTRNFPDIKRTVENIVSMARYGIELEAVGIATSVWGDFLNENLRENNYYGYLVTAEAAWAPRHWDLDRFNRNFAWLFFGLKDSKIIEVLEELNAYNEFHMIYPVKFFSHIWRHPFPGKKFKPKVKKLGVILQKSEAALSKIQELKSTVTRNQDKLDYLEYSAKLGIYLARKYQIAIEVQKNLNKGKNKFDPSEQIEKVEHLWQFLSDLRKSYEKLWLRCAKVNGLELILEKFDAGLFYYRQKIQEIERGILWQDPFLKSEFITAPVKVSKGDPIFLRKTIFIEQPVKSCFIQGMCDMLMHLYWNGEKLSEIVSKMSLSVEPIRQRIQYFNITDRVKNGKNVIAAECHNYLIPRVAGNIYLEIEYETGEKEIILSNNEWKASSVFEEGWEQIAFDDSKWEQAKSLGAPPKVSGHVTLPYFSAGIKSQDCYYYAMATFLKGLYPWAPFFLIEFLKKIVGMDIF